MGFASGSSCSNEVLVDVLADVDDNCHAASASPLSIHPDYGLADAFTHFRTPGGLAADECGALRPGRDCSRPTTERASRGADAGGRLDGTRLHRLRRHAIRTSPRFRPAIRFPWS